MPRVYEPQTSPLTRLAVAFFAILTLLTLKWLTAPIQHRRILQAKDADNQDIAENDILIKFPNGCEGLVHVLPEGFSPVTLDHCKPCDLTGSHPGTLPKTRHPTYNKPPSYKPTPPVNPPTNAYTPQPSIKPTPHPKPTHEPTRHTSHPTVRQTPRPTCPPTEATQAHIQHMLEKTIEENQSLDMQLNNQSIASFKFSGAVGLTASNEITIQVIFANGCTGVLNIFARNHTANLDLDNCIPCIPTLVPSLAPNSPTSGPHKPTPNLTHRPHVHTRHPTKDSHSPTAFPTLQPTSATPSPTQHTKNPTHRPTPKPPTMPPTPKPTCGCIDDLIENAPVKNSTQHLRLLRG